MVIKETAECPKCHTKPFSYDIVKVYKTKINGRTKHRIRCRGCMREMILPYIIIKKENKKEKKPSKTGGGKKTK